MTRDDIANKALEYVGVPFVATGRSKELGVDCTGLIICVIKDLGGDVEDFTKYSSHNFINLLLDKLIKYGVRVPSPERGTFTVFSSEKIHNHVCINLGNGEFVHANNSPTLRKVMKDRYNDHWNVRIHSHWLYRGVE